MLTKMSRPGFFSPKPRMDLSRFTPTTKRSSMITPPRTVRRAATGAPHISRATGNRKRPKRPTVYKSRYRARVTGMSRQKLENAAGFLDPFQPGNPRIMDGAAPASQVHSTRHVQRIAMKSATTHYVLVYAGVQNFCSVVYTPVSAAQTVVHYNINTNEFDLDSTAMGTPGASGAASTNGYLVRVGDIDKWRHTSTGVHLTLTNTDSSNDGIYHAWRVTTRAPIRFMNLIDTTSSTVFFAPNEFWAIDLGNDTNSTSRNSYVTGALKDIHKGTFNLHPITTEHPWCNVYDSFQMDDCHRNIGDTAWTFADWEALKAQKLMNSVFDDTFDCVVIKIEAGSNAPNLLVDVISNIEVIYDSDSALAKYHNKTTTDRALNKKLHDHLTHKLSAQES